MPLAGLTVPDTALVRDAIELSRNSLEPYLFNHVMRSWLFGVVLSLGAKPAPDPELLALSVVLHDLGLSDRYAAADRFEVDGANAARAFLKARGISEQQLQIGRPLRSTPHLPSPSTKNLKWQWRIPESPWTSSAPDLSGSQKTHNVRS